ncbi:MULTISPECIES: hypothetical protein [Fructobacillus]|uniref:Uncharacterized protein n=1 Tax=Fructobacillus cardui TaxID=2893170 RepID=A0ABM9MTV5_9LACO|nr:MULTISPECIES: hypothetical protein [Fructobacillus]KMK53484.1 hypothetical protein FEFB_07750 [Fructobacillus sp. EFB-N1]MCK8627789.1 hypothetical protein [Fructobacillus cardui]CAK1239736.1 unnamed protein product [Fructobacillus cardui]CAK1247006.1 unnamed protein product [Fructobacillus cardui]CAK1248052.1 unnamed protein product [Fructobacillus cardui]
MKIKRENMKDYYTFSSTAELTLFLGIERETLFQRAKMRGIDLNGTYTEEELTALKPAKKSALADLSIDSEAEIEILKMRLEMLESQLGYKDRQLDDRKQHIDTLKSTLEKAEQNLEKTQTTVDQQQHIQMATLSQLDKVTSRVQRIEMEDEQKKHWWSRSKKDKNNQSK